MQEARIKNCSPGIQVIKGIDMPSESSSGASGFAREESLRDHIYGELYSYFSRKTSFIEEKGQTSFYVTLFERWFVIEKEASLSYGLESNQLLHHKSDLACFIRER